MSTTTSDYAPLRLKKNEDRRLRAGHLWVYSNEIDTAVTPLANFAPGAAVVFEEHNGKFIGTGYVNPHALLCARLVSRDAAHPFSASLLVHRLKVALALRERLYAQPFYRLVYGEADGLPGLVVDRYGPLCVAQITTAGMEQMQDAILTALQKVIKPDAVLWRNDSSVRELEGLPSYVSAAYGEIPEQVEIVENNARFIVLPQQSQKTGWFYDQRDNRARLAKYVKGARVLDLFSYSGGWGIQAALAGAREVVCVDASASALEQVQTNAALNGVGEKIQTLQGDVFDVVKTLRDQRERFDVVVLDPPALIKRKKDLKEGSLAYRRLNEAAIRLLEKDGILVSCSCSHHMARAELVNTVQQSVRHLDRYAQLLEHGQQAPDHPLHPAIPETEYLKALFCRILPA